MGSFQGPGRWREAVLLWWGWKAGTGAGLGRGKQGHLTPEPQCSPGGTQDLCHLAGELPEKPSWQAAAVFHWFRTRDVQTAGSGPPVLPQESSCSIWAVALGSDVILGDLSLLWEQLSWGTGVCGEGLTQGLDLFSGLYWDISRVMCQADPHGWASLPSLGTASWPWMCLVDIWAWLSSLPSL